MTLRFVKTSVLVSEDGLDFSKETAVETEETRSARLARESAANKPLYQQLAEQKQKKQEEYDANTKLMFSAPKALDDEEYHFLESLHDAQEQAERFQKQEEEKALEIFRAARKVESSDNSATGKSTHAAVVLRVEQSSKPSLSLGTKITAIKAKRKVPDSNSEEAHDAKKPKIDTKVSEGAPDAKTNLPPAEKSSTKESDPSGLDLLCGYGSDDE